MGFWDDLYFLIRVKVSILAVRIMEWIEDNTGMKM